MDIILIIVMMVSVGAGHLLACASAIAI